jgi:hypothetical protein
LTFSRLARLDPVSDALYGSGYGTDKAQRYSWLLALKERIPDELVEEETDKYWQRRWEEEASLENEMEGGPNSVQQ